MKLQRIGPFHKGLSQTSRRFYRPETWGRYLGQARTYGGEQVLVGAGRSEKRPQKKCQKVTVEWPNIVKTEQFVSLSTKYNLPCVTFYN